MVMEFGQYKIDVHIKRTREFYERAEPVSKGCSCDGCLNFEKAVGRLPLAVTTFFTNLGIDLRKVCECYVNCTNDDETVLYGGFLHICGTLLHGDSAWKEVDEGVSHWEEDAAFCGSPYFHISFQETLSLLEEDFPLPVIQLDFTANIPWVLDKENTYRKKQK